VLDSGVALDGESLTFTWDFGDGPVDGTVRAFHIFETAGTHTVSITVSDGKSSTTDTVTVQAEPQPKTSGDIDEAGGAVSQGACTVTVPGGIASEAFTVEVTELPSMELASERKFDAERFVALGSAFDVSMLLKAGTAMDIAVKAPEAEGVDPSELAWLVRRLGRPHPEADELESTVSPALLANYVLLPVTRVDTDGTAHGDIYGRRRAQLVKMAEPLDAERDSAEAGLVTKAVGYPLLVTSFAHAPTTLSRQAFQAAVREGINRAHDLFVVTKGYRGPEAIVVSVTKMKSGIIRLILEDQFFLTHKTLPGAKGPIENLQWVDFLSSVKTLWTGVDFLEFVYSARYVKDFDTEEIEPRELRSHRDLARALSENPGATRRPRPHHRKREQGRCGERHGA
jgi:PKD repeat protein